MWLISLRHFECFLELKENMITFVTIDIEIVSNLTYMGNASRLYNSFAINFIRFQKKDIKYENVKDRLFFPQNWKYNNNRSLNSQHLMLYGTMILFLGVTHYYRALVKQQLCAIKREIVCFLLFCYYTNLEALYLTFWCLFLSHIMNFSRDSQYV